MEIKDVIRNNRIDLGLTMKEVADKVGVSEATVSRWESGDIENMRRDKISALAKALHIPLEVLMGWENSKAEKINKDIQRIEMEIAKHSSDEEVLLIERMLKSKEKARIMEYIRKVLELEELENI